jgi:ribonucleotide reductase beta subunit family protein with ferritin-like domain
VTDSPGVLAPADEARTLEESPPAFHALFEHWDRHQWSVSTLDFSVDAASFAALDEAEQQGMVWTFAHRFHAEFNVASLLAPFLDAAPSYEMALLLATQVADEYRHLEVVLRIYEDVFGVTGGIDAVRALADAHLDPVAAGFYEALERRVTALRHDRSERAFLQAILAYHVIAEGVIGSTANRLSAVRYEQLGFPGLAEGQRRVGLDEARHIGIGIAYARSRIRAEREAAADAVTEIVDEFVALSNRSLDIGHERLEGMLRDGYGADAATFYGDVLRFLQLRLRTIGYLDAVGDS